MTAKIGFLGAGQMARAMIDGILAKGVFEKDEVIACAPSAATRELVASESGIKVYATAAEVVEKTDFLVLAVKPAQVSGLFAEKGMNLGANHLLLSMVAGLQISTLESYVPDCRILRVMPNHCCMVLEGVSGFSKGTNVKNTDVELISRVLSAVGLAIEVEEKDLDAITGLCGSPPAYMYMIIDAMADGGVLCGLRREDAIKLAAQTMLGAAKTVLETGRHPDDLKDSVCSPGGTTIEGVRVLEDLGLRSAIIAAVQTGTERSREMSKKN